jgi:hypothetical protein
VDYNLETLYNNVSQADGPGLSAAARAMLSVIVGAEEVDNAASAHEISGLYDDYMVCARVYVCMHVYVYVSMFACMSVCSMYVCICMCTLPRILHCYVSKGERICVEHAFRWYMSKGICVQNEMASRLERDFVCVLITRKVSVWGICFESDSRPHTHFRLRRFASFAPL